MSEINLKARCCRCITWIDPEEKWSILPHEGPYFCAKCSKAYQKINEGRLQEFTHTFPADERKAKFELAQKNGKNASD